jgi:acetyl-CoA carboxylase carboxyltransferase component
VAHRAAENDIAALQDMRTLFDFLPLSNEVSFCAAPQPQHSFPRTVGERMPPSQYG